MIAFDFSNKYIHMVECSAFMGRITVKQAFSIPMPPQSIRNGFVTNSVALAKEIRDELLRRNIRDKHATVVLNSSTIKIKDVEVMATSEDYILELMQNNISDIIVDEEHLIDYMVQRSYKKNKVPFLYCTLVAIPYSLINSMSTVFKEARLVLKTMEIHSNAVSKLWELENPEVRNIGLKEKKPVKVKKVDKNDNDAEQGIIVGGDSPQEIIETDVSSFRIPISEPVKLRVGLYTDEVKMTTNGVFGELFTKTVVLDDDEDGHYSDVDFELDKTMTDEERKEKKEEIKKYKIMQYMQNISSFIAFQQSLNNGHRIQEIQLYGDEADIPNINDLIQRVAEIPTAFVTPPKEIKIPMGFDFPRYSCAIGALIKR